MELVVGKSGYVYVVGGTGTSAVATSSPRMARVTARTSGRPRTPTGDCSSSPIVEKSLAAGPGEISFERYPWKNEGESKARMKVAAVTYFQPWTGSLASGRTRTTMRMRAIRSPVDPGHDQVDDPGLAALGASSAPLPSSWPDAWSSRFDTPWTCSRTSPRAI